MCAAQQRKEDIEAIREYVAVTSVGPSTVRGYAENTKSICQRHLSKFPLDALAECSPREFLEFLDARTTVLMRLMSRNRKLLDHESYFGLARKVLNIFLRNSYYNQFLISRYNIAKHEGLFEVPIDSRSAAGIRRDCRDLEIVYEDPWYWNGLLYHDWDTNAQYQDAASRIAENEGTIRVHLDSYYYPEL